MDLIYNGISLSSLGTFRVLSRTTERQPVEAPQRERVTYRLRLDFFQQRFADNYSQVQAVVNALKTQNAVMLWQEAPNSPYENRTVTAGADSLPEDVMSRSGTYWQAVMFTFWYYNHDVVSSCLNATAFGLDMGAVTQWREGVAETRFNEMRDPRRRVEGRIEARGWYKADTTQSVTTRRNALLALKDAMLAKLQASASGNFTYGTFNRTVRVVSFDAQVDQPFNYIEWTLTAEYTRYPDESDYALVEYKVQTRVALPENISYLTLSGRIGAPTEALARARLTLLTTALVPAGYQITLNEATPSSVVSESDAVGAKIPDSGVTDKSDGSAFMELNFNLEYRDTSSLTCTWQRPSGTVVDLGTVDRFSDRRVTTLFDEMRDNRRYSGSTVSIRGRWYVSDSLSAADQQSALNAKVATLKTELRAHATGTLIYGSALNQSVRVLDFNPEFNRYGNCIQWSLTAKYTAWPNESDYALCEYRLATRNNLTDGTILKSLSGEIWAPTAVAAQAKLTSLRTALIPSGYTMVRDHTAENDVESDSDVNSGGQTGEGSAFIRLTVDEEWQATTSGSVLSWTLRIATDDESRSGWVRTTYSGSVTATAADQPTAYANALAQVNTLTPGVTGFLLSGSTTENERLFQTAGANVFVTVDFSYTYQTKGTRTFIECRSEVAADAYGQTVETVSGTVAAPTLAEALASYQTNVRAAALRQGALILSERTPNESYQRLDQNSGGTVTNLSQLDDVFSFSLQLLLAKSSGETAVNYSIRSESDVQNMEVRTTAEGTIYAADQATAEAFLATFLASQTLPGSLVRHSVTAELRQGPAIPVPPAASATATVLVAYKFRYTYISLLTGVSGILECDVSEDIVYSGNRIVEKGVPGDVSVIQGGDGTLGKSAGHHTVTARAICTTQTAADTWVAGIRTALLYSLNGSAIVAYEQPPRIRTAYTFLPLVTGVVTGASANVKIYEVNATFTEVAASLPYV